MRTIHKYHLPIDGFSQVTMPEVANILHAGEQDGELYIWALVDPDSKMFKRSFCILGTGHTMFACPVKDHIATVQMKNGLVWHIFTP